MVSTSHEHSEAARRILADVARAGQDTPALEALFAAFGPVLAAQAALREQAPGWTGDLPRVDEERFSQGLWVLCDSAFQDVSPLLPQAAASLLPLMEQAFPGLAQELAVLRRALEQGALSPQALGEAALGGEPAELAGVSPEALRFAAAQLVKPFLERQAQDLNALVRELPWRRGMCPVCGGMPNFSMLRKIRDDSEFIQAHGGQRMLSCATCATQWRCKRVSCPNCGNEEPEDLFNLRVESRPFERVDVCRKCKTYCLCLDTVEFVDIPDADVAALSMLPLEMLAREQGFAPLATHPWNAVL